MRLKPVLAAIFISVGLGSQIAAAGPTLLFDPADGKILYAEEPDDLWHPASVTKVMTAYLVFKAIREGRFSLTDKVVCSERALQQPPSKVGLPVGAELSVDLALQALIIKSANDVAVMLAEKVSGSEAQFVADMNAAARAIGMTRTVFTNPNGLPSPTQVTTARDLAKLARTVVREYPEYAPYWAMTNMRIGKIRLGSHNGLLKTFEGADGLKTGFICDSGFNVVASATRNGQRIMAVVLGEPTGQDRTLRAASLLEHGFQQYGWKTIFNSDTIDSLPVSPAARNTPQSVRQSIMSWDCGNGRRNPAVVARKERIKAAKAKARAKEKARLAQKGLADGSEAPVKANAAGTLPEVIRPKKVQPQAKPSGAGTDSSIAPVKKSAGPPQAAQESAVRSTQ
jgi:D-alanyl-D-alanine carboxypeptidase